ncbi:ATP-binding protein [Pantoea agglomerans]|uniref:ATP-binding protein n=1 Tax=Enterobacter agglomerans TaxID=549 RepID=UPI0024493393|nr:ATP-binding protein [Pantoea agglomerans]MDH1169488.1 ATP-binding protein [Pantoea agglomerans]
MDGLNVGFVTQVKGTMVVAKVDHALYQSTYFHNGKILRGIAINEFVLIRKGYQSIVGKIIGEEVIENFNIRNDELDQKKYDRYIELNILGYFFEEKFYSGIKFLPMINDQLYLISDEMIAEIYNFRKSKGTPLITIGKSILEEIPISIPINGVFNSHIGIFGNTGSGKSNTLAKLYHSLFKLVDENPEFLKKSKVTIIDFNGEYGTIEKSFPHITKIINLNTKNPQDKLFFSENEFWDDELLSVLFSATEKTQKPFLTHLVKNKKDHDGNIDNYFKRTISLMFDTNQHKETINLLKGLIPFIKEESHKTITDELAKFIWHSTNNKYDHPSAYINKPSDAINLLNTTYNSSLIIESVFDEIFIRSTLQLINSVSKNYVQYEHISPLVNKITATGPSLSKVIEVNDLNETQPPVSIISLKSCNQATKKTIPMMIAKCSFLEHKSTDNDYESFHLIIDEAHNILSESSSREAESWKDYRLELFEEIIKEGRKFGYFVTLSSQRPYDISPTIISQLHNYFIHRLVNENDLFLLKNTLSTLDASSRSLIPTLPPGACIVSGTAFHTPLIVQMERLTEDMAPQSDTLNLEALWGLE